MDKTKIGAVVGLVAIGGLLLFSKMQDAPAPEADPDHAEESAQSAPKAPAKGVDYVGGIRQLKTDDSLVGTGPAAKAGDKLTMFYKGSLVNGEVFDQNFGGKPFEFTLGAGQVIKGWDEGIRGMKVGGKRGLQIPADKGYGPNGSPPKIPGGASLIFEVELLKINGK